MTARPAALGFLFDLNACTGCNACQLACSTENQLGWGNSWRQVLTFNPQRVPSIATYHLSLACNHCAQAPCMQQCPALAIRRDAATGAVLIDPQRCIGCGYCSWVCPYDAPVFDEGRRVMTKCTWCNHRLAEGQVPACVEQCPTGALGFGPLEGAPVVDGFPDTPAQPAIRFRPMQRKPVETSWQPAPDDLAAIDSDPSEESGKISLSKEWPLLVFTLIMAGLVGWLTAALGGGSGPHPILFGALAGLAALTSTLHLGRKQRAWRAALNLRGSWLSREIASFGAFAAASMAVLLTVPNLWPARLACAALGLIHLFCVDRVYDPVRPRRLPSLHSADTLPTALMLAGLLTRTPLTFCLLGGWKLALDLIRRLRSETSAGSWLMGLARTGVGILFPCAVLLLDPAVPLWLPLTAFAIGEAANRIEFYRRLEPLSPKRQIAIDLMRSSRLAGARGREVS